MGLNLQSNLKWDSHFEDIINRCNRAMNVIKFLRNTWYGADPSLLLTIYQGLIRSKMEYAGFVWNNVPDYLWNRLETLQNRAVRVAMGYRKSTPINVLLVEACVPRMADRIRFLGMNYMTRTLGRSNHALIPILNRMQNYIDNPTSVVRFPPLLLLECFSNCNDFAHLIFESEISVHCLYPVEVEFAAPNICYDIGMQVKESDYLVQVFNSLVVVSETQHIFYTDGSKSENLPFSGFSYVDVTNNICSRFRSSDRTSIFSCEAMAILSVLKAVRDSNKEEIVIFSDSLSVLKALESVKKRKKSRLVWEICNEIVELQQAGKQVSLYWIPAHVGIQVNEKADREAREACISGADTDLLLPGSDFRAGWKEELFNSLQE